MSRNIANQNNSIQVVAEETGMSMLDQRTPKQINFDAKALQQQQRGQLRRDIATAAAAMRIGYSNNRKDLLNNSRLSAGQDGYVPGPGKSGSHSLEPGFRVYGKNQAAREFNDIVKVKHKVYRLSHITPKDSGLHSTHVAEFSFRAKTTGKQSPRDQETMYRSYNRDQHPYLMSQGGKGSSSGAY